MQERTSLRLQSEIPLHLVRYLARSKKGSTQHTEVHIEFLGVIGIIDDSTPLITLVYRRKGGCSRPIHYG